MSLLTNARYRGITYIPHIQFFVHKWFKLPGKDCLIYMTCVGGTYTCTCTGWVGRMMSCITGSIYRVHASLHCTETTGMSYKPLQLCHWHTNYKYSGNNNYSRGSIHDILGSWRKKQPECFHGGLLKRLLGGWGELSSIPLPSP